MPASDPEFDEQAALRRIVEGTASETGERFFRSLVENLSLSLGTMGGWVARLNPDRAELCAIALKVRERWWENFVYQVQGTPCETALEERRVVHIPDRVLELYRGERLEDGTLRFPRTLAPSVAKLDAALGESARLLWGGMSEAIQRAR